MWSDHRQVIAAQVEALQLGHGQEIARVWHAAVEPGVAQVQGGELIGRVAADSEPIAVGGGCAPWPGDSRAHGRLQ